MPESPDLQTFVAHHLIDILFILFVGGKSLIGSTTNLRTRVIGIFLILGVLYIGQIVDTEYQGQIITFAVYLTVAIVIRLVALKILYLLITSMNKHSRIGPAAVRA
jgi:hypothetical protein